MADQNYYIKVEGLDELISDFKKAGANFGPLMRQAIDKSVTRLQNETRENITSKGISNTGSLRRSVVGKTESETRGVMRVGERYGAAVEYGSRPHFPPVAPIERWAQTKLGVAGIGFIIARKIARKGTKAQPYVEPAFKNAGYVGQYFRDAVDRMVQTMATGR